MRLNILTLFNRKNSLIELFNRKICLIENYIYIYFRKKKTVFLIFSICNSRNDCLIFL